MKLFSHICFLVALTFGIFKHFILIKYLMFLIVYLYYLLVVLGTAQCGNFFNHENRNIVPYYGGHIGYSGSNIKPFDSNSK